ncbi:unnamed protein product [Leptidea sinapis]|uniref:Serpin domain-containing protein n=2 Tax=Leptidea sinapis TaxID=189913 RepID=A0A5E4QBV5_9NEOP|nr:unnamed protein product [Leptidea sinapis]
MRLLFVCFLAHWVKCNENYTLSPELLQSVFGNLTDIKPLSDEPIATTLKPLSEPGLVLYKPDNYRPSFAEYDKFDWTLTKRVAVTAHENFLISPLGLKLSLAILVEAASGATRSEISNVLGLDLKHDVVRKKFETILESLQAKSDKYILDLGSRIYVGASVRPPQKFAVISKQYYNTDIISLDLSNSADAATSINSWVSNVTQGRIPNLVNQDDINGVVAMVLNTLYFKGTWRHQFSVNDTKLDSFYVTPDNKKPTLFMHVRRKFFYAESVKFSAKILRMSYIGCKFAMYVIVPNSLTGLPQIFNNIIDLRSELGNLTERLVDVILPKFHFEYTSVLDEVLRELGIRQAFEDTASFPGISRGQTLKNRLKISKVLQRSGIEVNELGSIAYSATDISLDNKFGEDDDMMAQVIANKPFMFFIQDEETRQLLFTGRVVDPTLGQGELSVK